MRSKTILMEQIERERTFLAGLEPTDEAYDAAANRLLDLEKQLFEQEDRLVDTIINVVKVVGTGIAMPVFGLIWITATEKEGTFRGVLKDYTKYFFPKK